MKAAKRVFDVYEARQRKDYEKAAAELRALLRTDFSKLSANEQVACTARRDHLAAKVKWFEESFSNSN
jgi:hypothetical protein